MKNFKLAFLMREPFKSCGEKNRDSDKNRVFWMYNNKHTS